MPTKRLYSSVGQEVVEEVLENGLRVVVLPKPGFQTRYATFCTKYGGMDNEFYVGESTELLSVPEGIAHFLEHKMFEQPDGLNALEAYSRMGARANAFTAKDKTVYLFSVTDADRFVPAFDLLLDYVQTPHFTDENVSKEQGIIQQEIAARLDSPSWVAWVNLGSAMYHFHPAKASIIGTAESVGSITKEHLSLCHRAFYHPSNMLVVVAGDVDPAGVIGAVRADCAGRVYDSGHLVRRVAPQEPRAVKAPFVSGEMKVSRSTVYVGFKGAGSSAAPTPAELQKRQLLGDIICGALFGRTSKWYWHLYGKGIVTKSFGCAMADYGSAFHLYGGGETEDSGALVEAMTSVLARACDGGVAEEDFELARRAAVGDLLSDLDSPADLAERYLADALDGIDMLSAREVLEELRPEDATELLRQLVGDDRRVVSVVTPIGEGSRVS